MDVETEKAAVHLKSKEFRGHHFPDYLEPAEGE
jgi:hypothetical protein